ncbi:MAG: GAF domain-containing protein [Anaerolineae bacterium]|nr:GAF domain-containing protein [Anaerolineae bacterium]
MNSNLQTLHQLQLDFRQAQTPEALIEVMRQTLTLLLPSIINTQFIYPADKIALPNQPLLVQDALGTKLPQVSDDEQQIVVPITRFNVVSTIFLAQASSPLSIQDVAMLVLLGRVMTDNFERLTWPLSPTIYRQIVDEGGIPFDVVDDKLNITYVNAAWLQLYGYESPDQVIGKPVSDLYFSINIDDLPEQFSFSKSDPFATWTGDVIHRDISGRELPLQIFIFPLRDVSKNVPTQWGSFKLSIREQNALMESLEQQARRLRAAVEVARVTIVQQELDPMLREIALVTQQLFNYDLVAIGLLEGARIVIKGLAMIDGKPVRLVKDFALDESSLNGYVASTGKAIIANNVRQEPRYLPQVETPMINAELVVPMKIGGRVIGTFTVSSSHQNEFNAVDEETFQGIADQIAVAVENMRLLAAERRRIQELSVVNEISRLIMASSYELEPMWEPIYEHMRTLFTLSTFYVMLYDQPSDTLQFAYLVDMGRVMSFMQPVPVSGLSAEVIRQGKTVRYDDLQRDGDHLRQQGVIPRRFVDDYGYTRSWLGVPLRARDNSLLGMISIQSYEPYVFTEGDERLLSTLAALISLAVENSRLFGRLSDTASRLEKRAQRLEFLAQLGTLLSSSLDREYVLNKAAEQIVKLMDVDHCGMVILDDAHNYGIVIAEYPNENMTGSKIPVRNNPIYESHKVRDHVIYDTAVETGPLRDLLVSQGINMMLVSRMMGKDRLLGSIGLDMMQRQREFTEEDIDLFRIIVHQVALTIENTDLYVKALAASELKSQFLATMSHELRTPMNAIIGYTEMVLTGLYGPLTDTQHDRLQRVYGNAKSLLDLINDVLDLSKIESGNMRLDITSVEVVPLVINAISNVAPIAEAKKLRITTFVPDYEVTIMADAQRLRQIMLNLLSNAVKFTREGGIIVRAYTFSVVRGKLPPGTPIDVDLDDGEWVALAVEDTGIGIESDNFELIFDAFRQLDGSSVREYPGTGLGLTITKQLVDMHRGQIWVKSEPGVGSVFTVVLPMRLPTEADDINDNTKQTDLPAPSSGREADKQPKPPPSIGTTGWGKNRHPPVH